jgi:hypothetical protein
MEPREPSNLIKRLILSKNYSQTAKNSHFLQKKFDQHAENEELKVCYNSIIIFQTKGNTHE